MNENADTGIAGAAVVAPPRRSRLRPLLALWPFAARHRGRIALAFVALLIAALATLAVPIALRRMIDFGFAPDRIGLIDQYFAVMILVAAILAAASAARFYLVTTIGEHVYHPAGAHAHLRNAVMRAKSQDEWFDTLQWLYGSTGLNEANFG